MNNNTYDTEKEGFLKEFGEDYGYPNAPNNIDHIRATQFNRLDGVVYLDHAGATLYSELQMEAIFKDLTSNVYANPHSQSNSSSITCDNVEAVRQKILSFYNASPKEYKCIFTSGATAALKLVGEAFPWERQSSFMYTMENHNSVLGIREYALSKGAAAFAVDIEETELHSEPKSFGSSIKVVQHHIQRRSEAICQERGEPTGSVYNLFAFPSECNFSGVRFNLDLVKTIKEDSQRILEGSPCNTGSWMVLIDAAKGCATQPPDLSKYKADFVVMSFYKLFGYPTGLGALIVRNEAAKLLKKTYFSGGTVAASIADIDFVKRREDAEELFEDGTISFLSITSVLHGFKIIDSLTMPAISRHTASLATYVRNMLFALRHDNGSSVCKLYGVDNSKVSCSVQGPIVSFNLKRPDGSWFGYREVEKLASLSGIQLRTGCFCNPGACAKYLGLSLWDLMSNIEAGHVCWDDHDILHGKPTGSVRISFGYMSNFEDARKFMNFIVSSFVSLPSQSGHVYPLRSRSIPPPAEGLERATSGYHLRSIAIYPIKSCAGFRVQSWPLSSTGLLHDREWVLKSRSGEILTQKKVPEMCYISTLIDLKLGILFVESPNCKEKLQIRLELDSSFAGGDEMDIHTQRYEVRGYADVIDSWFGNAIGRPCTLLRSCGSNSNTHLCSNKSRSVGMCRDVESRLNFVNEAQFLLISEESVSDLNNRLSTRVPKDLHGRQQIQVNEMRFRPNLVISGGKPYEEDRWTSLTIGNCLYRSLGGCNRCQMINLNSEGEELQRSNEPLATLAAYRRAKGKICFGILLKCDASNKVGEDTGSLLQVGQEVYPNTE
ncbi:hypothetical protein LguiB_030335 [Lonicera macranthoides]